jgi:hypothetical protein
MEKLGDTNWYIYRGCYVLIDFDNGLYSAKICNVDDKSFFVSDADKDGLLIKAKKMVNVYLKPYNFIDRARKIPYLKEINFLDCLRMADSIITKDRILLNNAFKRYGYGEALRFAFHGIFLHNTHRSGMLDLSRFLHSKKEFRLNKKIVILSGLLPNHFVSFKNNTIFGVIEAIVDRSRGLLRLEFDSQNVSSGCSYEFNLHVDGSIVDVGFLRLNNNDCYIECEILGCDKLIGKLPRKYSAALLDDYNFMNELIPWPSSGNNEAINEVLKCQIAAFLRFSVFSGADTNKLKIYLEKFNFPYLNQFFNNYAFAYDEIKDIKPPSVDYSEHVNAVLSRNLNLSHWTIFLKNLTSVENLKISKDIFDILRQNVVHYKVIGQLCGTPDEIISMYKLCWKHILGSSLRDKIFLCIIDKVVSNDYEDYKDICKRLGNDVAGLDDIAKEFHMNRGYDSDRKQIRYPSQFIDSRLDEIEKIATRNGLPLMCRKKGTAKSKVQ